MVRYFCLVVVLAVAYTAGGLVEIGILNGFSSTLHYVKGNCSWRITTRTAGIIEDREVSVGPQRGLVGDGDTNRFTLKCVSEGTVQLNAVILTHNVDAIPAPTNISLDNEAGVLDWNHIFHPSLLPLDFKITHEHNISYLVNVTDRDSGERGETLTSNETSLDISGVLDHCRSQEFTVQVLVNGQFYGQAVSFTHEPNVSTAPEFVHLMASFELGSPLRVRVQFELEPMNCLSQFTIAVHGVANISFNVTRADVARGMVIHDLSSDLTLMDVCDFRNESEIYGGNEIGNSTPVEVRAQRACQMPTSSTAAIVSSPPTPVTLSEMSTAAIVPSPPPAPVTLSTVAEQHTSSPTTPTIQTSDPTPDPSPVIATVAIIIVLLGVAIISIVIILFFVVRKQRKGRRSKVAEDPPLQTNEAYCTVTTGVPMQRNEAYETVPRPSATTTHSHTSPVYEIVH